jgi:hypothetical protein
MVENPVKWTAFRFLETFLESQIVTLNNELT